MSQPAHSANPASTAIPAPTPPCTPTVASASAAASGRAAGSVRATGSGWAAVSAPTANAAHSANAALAEAPASAAADAPAGARTDRIKRIVANLCPVVVPTGLYYVMVAFGYSSHIGLLCSAVVAGLWVLGTAVLQRRFDGLAGFVLAINLLGLVLALVSGSERMMLAKDPITDAVIGVLLFASCVLGRPAMFGVAQRLHASGADQVRAWNALWHNDSEVRRIFLRSTLVWGGAFAAAAVLRGGMIAALPVSVVVGLTNPVEWGVLGLAFAYSMHTRKQMNIAARIAAA